MASGANASLGADLKGMSRGGRWWLLLGRMASLRLGVIKRLCARVGASYTICSATDGGIQPLRSTQHILFQIVDGLGYCHSQGRVAADKLRTVARAYPLSNHVSIFPKTRERRQTCNFRLELGPRSRTTFSTKAFKLSATVVSTQIQHILPPMRVGSPDIRA